MADIPFTQHYIIGQVGPASQQVPPAAVAQDQEIMAGQTVCYNATGTITVAGNGTTFIVHDGGSATMVAGERIQFLPGTFVRPGGYLYGYIETGNQYCGSMAPAMPAAGHPLAIDTPLKDPGLKVFPNPTSGKFTLSGLKWTEKENISLELYTMCGELKWVTSTEPSASRQFNLTGYPAGLYFLKVTEGNETKIIKIQIINQ
jgi:hypothetical protein